jgi:hypothetical protein
MKSSRIAILKDIYEAESKGENLLSIPLDGRKDAKSLIEDVRQLIADGYLTEPVKTTRQLNLKLTDQGWDFVENGCQKGIGAMSVTGDNNIIISGNGNIVSDNFNHVQAEISQADLSEEQKQQLEELLEKIKAIKVDGTDTKGRIRSVVGSFLIGIASNVGAVPVIELVTALCNNI